VALSRDIRVVPVLVGEVRMPTAAEVRAQLTGAGGIFEVVTEEVGRRLGLPTELVVESSYESCEKDQNEACFVCSLPYVIFERRGLDLAIPVAAPVLQGDRYGGRPIYFSDVIVHRDSPLGSFLDLRGRSWAYNEPLSHSGYGITRYHLLRLGETDGFFGDVVDAIWEIDPLRGKVLHEVERYGLYPGSHYVTPEDQRRKAIASIRAELSDRLAELEAENTVSSLFARAASSKVSNHGDHIHVQFEFSAHALGMSMEEAVAYAKRNGIPFRIDEPEQPKLEPKSYADNFKFGRLDPWTH
jgi:hypothetical protein